MAKSKDKETDNKQRQKFANKSKIASGRPREHNREKIAQEMLEWAKLDTSTNLLQFCTNREPPLPSYMLCEWADTDKDFHKAYRIAKDFLGWRREQKLSQGLLNSRAYEASCSAYDYIVRREKRKQMEFEHSLKLQQEAQTSEATDEAYAKTIKMLKSMQEDGKNQDSARSRLKNKKSKDK